uniref:Uncharacterized protein n=1 Tax=Anopheles albimanus TaxID=7167 RepID=A0A182F5Q0_ANOAL
MVVKGYGDGVAGSPYFTAHADATAGVLTEADVLDGLSRGLQVFATGMERILSSATAGRGMFCYHCPPSLHPAGPHPPRLPTLEYPFAPTHPCKRPNLPGSLKATPTFPFPRISEGPATVRHRDVNRTYVVTSPLFGVSGFPAAVTLDSSLIPLLSSRLILCRVRRMAQRYTVASSVLLVQPARSVGHALWPLIDWSRQGSKAFSAHSRPKP